MIDSLQPSCYLLNVCVPSKSICWSPNPHMMVFGRSFWKAIRFWETHESGDSMMQLMSFLIRPGWQTRVSLSLPVEDPVRKKSSVSQQGSYQEWLCRHLDLELSIIQKCKKINFCCLRPLSLWNVIIAA